MFWLKKSRISMLLLCLFFMTQTVSALDVVSDATQLELSNWEEEDEGWLRTTGKVRKSLWE